MKALTRKARARQHEHALELLPEPDRTKIYLDARGRRWRYCDVIWFAGWQVGPEMSLRLWENARREFFADLPLREMTNRNVPVGGSPLTVVAQSLKRALAPAPTLS